MTTQAKRTRPLPDFNYVHMELKKKGVTLLQLWAEYREEHPDGYGQLGEPHHLQLQGHRQRHRAASDPYWRSWKLFFKCRCGGSCDQGCHYRDR